MYLYAVYQHHLLLRCVVSIIKLNPTNPIIIIISMNDRQIFVHYIIKQLTFSKSGLLFEELGSVATPEIPLMHAVQVHLDDGLCM